MQVCQSSRLTRGRWQRISPWCSLDSLSFQKPDKIYSLSPAFGNIGVRCSGDISDFRRPHKYQHWGESQLFPGNREIHHHNWLRLSRSLMLLYSSKGYSWVMPNVFGELLGVLQSAIPRATVWHKPGHLLSFIASIINTLGLRDDAWIIILPGLIWGHYCTVLSAMKQLRWALLFSNNTMLHLYVAVQLNIALSWRMDVWWGHSGEQILFIAAIYCAGNEKGWY